MNQIIDNKIYKIQNNQLEIDGITAKELLDTYGSPLFVISETYIQKKCREIREGFLEKYPNTRAAYAGKAFLPKQMCNIIDREGLCLDVVSGGELYTAIKADFPPEKIEFNGNNKSLEELEMAISYGVGRIIIDGTDEIQLIEEVCDKLGTTTNAIIRVSPGVDSHTHEYITTGMKDSKFGIPLDAGIYDEVVGKAINSKYINMLGFHFHVGSQLHDNTSHLMATDVIMGIVKEAKEKWNFDTKELNVGGGFGITYTEEDDEKPYTYFLDPIMAAIKEGFEKIGMDMPAVVIEPGRSIVGNAGVTLYTIGTVKHIEGIRKYISVDGGMTDNIRPALYGSKYEFLLANKAEESLVEPVTVSGKCCESGDIIGRDIHLPKVERGDLLAVFSTGAYCYTMSSNYNKVPIPAVVITNEKQHRLAVRRQTYADLIEREL